MHCWRVGQVGARRHRHRRKEIFFVLFCTQPIISVRSCEAIQLFNRHALLAANSEKEKKVMRKPTEYKVHVVFLHFKKQ